MGRGIPLLRVPKMQRSVFCDLCQTLGTEKYLPPPPPREQERKSSEAKLGSIHPYGRYGNAVKTWKTISTIAVLWPVKAIFEKRAATVEVDSFASPETCSKTCDFHFAIWT